MVLDHLFGWPTGGFLGVDIFFVISGYLITSLLIEEDARSGGISFRAFYARRLRRIVPAALVVLILTDVTSFAVWYLPRATGALLDGVASLVFVENWHLVVGGSDYLHATGAVSPLQHYWSLAVEEQFYAFWPLALATLLKLLPIHARKRGLIAAVGALAAISLAWAAYRTHVDPSAAYFDSIARAWELLVGALLALWKPKGDLDRGLRLVGSLGLVLLFGGIFFLNSRSPFPWPGALVPVFGAAFIITGNGLGLVRILETRPAQYFGRISYSLYLWHFPIIIFVQVLSRDWFVTLAALPVTVVLAEVSYRFIERPTQRLPALRRWGAIRYKARNRLDVAVAVVVVASLLVMVGLQYKGPALLRQQQGPPPIDVLHGKVEDSTSLPFAIQAAVGATSWTSSARRALDVAATSQQAEAMRTVAPGCRNNVGDAPALICSYPKPGSSRKIMVLGDSVALSWVPAVRAAFPGYSVVAMGYASCSIMQVSAMPRVRDARFPRRCHQARESMLRLAEQQHPSVVLVSGDEAAYSRLVDHASGDQARLEWVRGMTRTLRRLAAASPHVVLLDSPPVAASPETCASRFDPPSKCLAKVQVDHYLMAAAARTSVAAVASPRVVWVDAEYWFCTADGQCPAEIDGTLIRTDNTHITSAAAVLVSCVLHDSLTRIGV